MKIQTQTNLLIRSSLVLALALIIWSPGQIRSAEPAEKKMKMDGKMMERCQAIKEQKEKMREEMKAQDAELTALVAKMNQAPRDQKVDLMAGIVTQMVEQGIARRERQAKMKKGMMQHMMQHRRMGKGPMAKCPMMKRMKGMKGMDDADEKPAEAAKSDQTEQE